MRCKKHGTDLSSIVGVCATCLRERLFRVVLAQEQAQAQSLEQVQQNHSNSNTNPTVPRSVSPFISHRKSVTSENPVAIVQRPCNKPGLNHSVSEKRFYNSPQIAITGGCIGGGSSITKKPTLIRFPSISKLFRSNSRNGDANSNHRVSVSSSTEPCGGGGGRPSSVTPSPSWISNVLPGAGVRQCSTIASTCVVRKQRCVSDRGLSPVRTSDDGGADESSDGPSAYESAESCRQTPMKTPSVRRRGGQKSVTELIFRPLVRPSPNRLFGMKGKPPVDLGFSGDTRAQAVPHISCAKSFSANRSRKLADFGRSDPSR